MRADGEDGEVARQVALLQSGWFTDAKLAGPMKSAAHQQAVIAARDKASMVTAAHLLAEDVERAISNLLFDDAPTAAQHEAVKELLSEFATYCDHSTAAFAKLPFAARMAEERRFEIAIQRLADVGAMWSRNMDFFRCAAPLRECSSLQNASHTAASIIDFLAAAPIDQVLTCVSDDRLFDQLVPPADRHHTGVTEEHMGSVTHPLAPHELFWLSRDEHGSGNFQRAALQVSRAFGAREREVGRQELVLEAEEDARRAAVEWMVENPEIAKARLQRIAGTMAMMSRGEITNTLVRCLCQQPDVVKHFGGFIDVALFPFVDAKLVPHFKQKLGVDLGSPTDSSDAL